ncbi:MAG: hypothetical protein H7096_14415 [Flavobacterium sp.]|nr:hypothetical protein [Pedobacter sp.]
MQDNRKTVYWNANILTGADGKTTNIYFNALPKGRYRIVIEGWSENGSLLHSAYSYMNK